MPRYAGQHDGYRCGPIACLNALKWAGARVTLKKDLKKISNRMRCVSGVGVYVSYFEETIRSLGKEFFQVERCLPSICAVERALENDSAVVVSFLQKDEHKQWEWHLALLVGVTHAGKNFISVNYYLHTQRRAVMLVHRLDIIADLRRRKSEIGGTPRAWILTRRA